MGTPDSLHQQQSFDDFPTQPLGPGERVEVERTAVASDGGVPVSPSAGNDSKSRSTNWSGRQKHRGPHISRRTLLVGAGLAGAATVAVAAGVGIHNLTSPSLATGSLAANQQIAHLLRRAGFGVAPGELETYSALGLTGAVDRLLNFQHIPNTVMDQYIAAATFDFTVAQDILNWWLARMTYSAHPLEEKMTLFWHGLLTSSFRKVGGKRGFGLIKQNNDFLRQNAFARFDDILAGITIDPAMLIWLDGNNSRAGDPNENFAREEMELFTMGIGNYTQTDIEQSARALTGWRVNPLTGKATLIPRFHDDTEKTFLGQTGNFDYKDIARIICAQAITPVFLATRLWRFFAYQDPSIADIQPLVDAYHNHDHSVEAMMRAMLTSSAFYSSKAYRARIKSPIEFVVGAFRNLGLSGFEKNRNVLGALEVMGQAPYDPPNVAGWPGDQASGNWINTGAWMTRVNAINTLVVSMNRSPDFMQRLQADIQKQHISSSGAFVDYVAVQLIDSQIDSTRRQMLIDYLAADDNAGGKGVTLVGGNALSGASVRGLYYLVMSMPEYQLS
jgi:uncharacterized protein (DUF1800 family)